MPRTQVDQALTLMFIGEAIRTGLDVWDFPQGKIANFVGDSVLDSCISQLTLTDAVLQ
jgi:hypothetical protein